MPAATVPCQGSIKHDKAAHRAAEVVRRGGLVVFPTETVYGIAASIKQARGIERLRELMNLDPDSPLTVHLPSASAAGRFIDLDEHALLRRLVRKTMPGPIAVVVHLAPEAAQRMASRLELTPDQLAIIYRDGKIGLRCPDHPVAAALLGAMDEPIVAAAVSVNGVDAHDADVARSLVGDKVDLILDGGPTRHHRPSTVVELDGDDLRVIRPGVYDERYIDKLRSVTLLFVCSGNTCRSPMAQAIARHELAQRGLDHVEVISAGTSALSGMPMTPEAAAALAKLGIHPRPHASRPLTTSLASSADAIFCMTSSHLLGLSELAPGVMDRASLLDLGGEDVDDPIGAGRGVYVECAQRIGDLIRRRLDELGLTARRRG
jgi:protein-tyrosine phosphatase